MNFGPIVVNDDDLSSDECNCDQCEERRYDDTLVAGVRELATEVAGQPLWAYPQLDVDQLTLFESARELIRRTINEPGWEVLDDIGGIEETWDYKLRESYACGFVDDIGSEGVERPVVLRLGHPFADWSGLDDTTVYVGDGHHRIVAAAVHDQVIPVVWARETFATVNGDAPRSPFGVIYADPDADYDDQADRCHHAYGSDDYGDVSVAALL